MPPDAVRRRLLTRTDKIYRREKPTDNNGRAERFPCPIDGSCANRMRQLGQT
ncbi:hypothetical protein IMZ48_44335 [Candidatus Bathyarchaeota archaeon]|nr:hypothetical protein [Candidatus Bathyarchaeota archaeon]